MSLGKSSQLIVKCISQSDLLIHNKNEEDNESKEEYDGKGGGEPVELTKIIEESSAVSIMQDDIGKIVSKGINMISPLSGTITSNYGARDQIFEGVTSYHTGIDIATKKGVEIKSSTEGKVVKVQENDKYYGNNVLIAVENDRPGTEGKAAQPSDPDRHFCQAGRSHGLGGAWPCGHGLCHH